MSRVDVIVPCYKYGHYLRECVESVLTQEGVDVRVLIIDDCSPDNTPEVGQQLAREDSRVEYRRHMVNQGHIATYNEGLEWASGEYTLLLSADDLVTKGAFHRAARVLDEHPEVVLCYGKEIKTSNPSASPFVVPRNTPWRILTGSAFVELCCNECYNVVSTPSAMVRTRIQHQIGGYRKDLPHSGDLEMWLRFGAHGSVAILDCEQAYYRVHATNMALQYKGIPNLIQLRAAFYTLFENYGNRLPSCEGLYRLARRNLASQFFWEGQGLFERGNVAGSAEYFKLTLETDPSFRYRPEWWSFQCKRLMGPDLWASLRPMIRRLRNKRRLHTA